MGCGISDLGSRISDLRIDFGRWFDTRWANPIPMLSTISHSANLLRSYSVQSCIQKNVFVGFPIA